MTEVMVLLAWLALALGGGELVLSSDRPVVAYVGMSPHPLKGGNHEVVVPLGDEDGTQRVTIRNLLQDVLWQGDVEVPTNTRVRVTWMNRRGLVSDPAPLQQRRKLSQRGLYNVDGEWVRDRPLQDPGSVRPAPGAPSPVAQPKEDAFLGAVKEAAAEGEAGGQRRDAEVVIRPAAGEGEGVLLLKNRTTSWANLVVDGEAIPFRGERSKELTLDSGPHEVEIRNISEKLVHRGTVWVWPGETVELQFSEPVAPAAPDRPDAWQSKALPTAVSP